MRSQNGNSGSLAKDAPLLRKRPRDLNTLCLGLAIALLLVPVTQGRGQNSTNTSILDQAGALQSKLGHWREVLSNLNLNLLPLTDAQRELLERERSSCLASIHSLGSDIAAIQANPTLAGEAQLALDATRMEGRAFALQDSLLSVSSPIFWSVGQPARISTLRQESEIGGMAGVPVDVGQITRELDAIGVTQAAAKPQQPGEISGHVYRADNSQPLAEVRVMLEAAGSFGPPIRSTQTAPNGGYSFLDVAPGHYVVGGYLAGFERGYYRPHRPQNTWTTINLASSQKVSGIDVRLHPLAHVTQMNEEALFDLYPEGQEEVSFFGGGSHGRFSADGRRFAIETVGSEVGPLIWIYNLASRRLARTAAKAPMRFGGVSIGWVGDTLYEDYLLGPGCSAPDCESLLAVTPEGTHKIQALPPAAKEALRQDRMHQAGTASNGRFTVSAVPPTCYHCTGLDLTARAAAGGKTYTIAGGSWELGSFIFEPDSSLVFYPKTGFPYAIVTYDLSTRQKHLTYLANGAQLLLDATRQSAGYLVAYISSGPCQGYGQGTGFYPWPVPPVRPPSNVCFAQVPLGAMK